jgi:SAM-dependent methyltransferase
MMNGAPHSSPKAAYEAFAAVYDLFTADHDYDLWVTSIERLCRRHGLSGTRLLDVACGTGKSLAPWLERGYDAAGCDLSPRMLDRAHRKIGLAAELFVADMRQLPPIEPVDLVTCLDDALNYLLAPDDVGRAFGCAAACLRRGGTYVFDLNTLRAYREDFAATHSLSRAGWDFTWQGHGTATAPEGSISRATIVARRTARPARAPIQSEHTQRHHPIGLVRQTLAEHGLQCLAVYGQHRDGSTEDHLDEAVHTKALVLARKT